MDWRFWGTGMYMFSGCFQRCNCDVSGRFAKGPVKWPKYLDIEGLSPFPAQDNSRQVTWQCNVTDWLVGLTKPSK